jgi:hypothetical protein
MLQEAGNEKVVMASSREFGGAAYRVSGTRAYASASAGGPWNPSLQHGGAPAALVAWIVESFPSAVPMQVARLTVNLLKPVPILPLDISTELVRDGRKVQTILVRLSSEGKDYVRAVGVQVREQKFELPSSAALPARSLPGPEAGNPATDRHTLQNPFLEGISMQVVEGGFRAPGPASVWYRIDRPILERIQTSPLMRASIVSDFTNGSSSVLSYDEWTFLNADLTVNLARQPIGEWILSQSTSWIGPQGMGVAFATLSDRHGVFGRCAQTIIIERRAAPQAEQ